MEAARKKMDAVDSLIEDLIFEIIRRLPTRSLIRCTLVYKSWRRLISESDNQDKLPQTVVGFFYDTENFKREVIEITSFTRVSPSLEFLPFDIEDVAVSDCCNGLIQCWCRAADGCRYVICNPMTKHYKILPPSTDAVGHAVGEARLCFDPTASSNFHVIEYVDGEDAQCVGVEIYSSKTAAWIYKESGWGEGTDVTMFRSQSVFLNGCMHIMGDSEEHFMILAVDMEGNTWRKIGAPSGRRHSMHQAQGHLCVCLVEGTPPNDSKLSIWILEDYGTNNWTLKHTVSTLELFGRINIRFGFSDLAIEEHTVITVLPEWNLIFFAGKDRTIIAYYMDHRKVHDIPDSVFWYGRRIIKEEFICRPYYLPYVRLFSDSLGE